MFITPYRITSQQLMHQSITYAWTGELLPLWFPKIPRFSRKLPEKQISRANFADLVKNPRRGNTELESNKYASLNNK